MAEPELTEEDIHAIARRIQEAMRHPIRTDGPDDILDMRQELSADDEDRVAAALARLRVEAASPDSDSGSSADTAKGTAQWLTGSEHTGAGAPTSSTPGYGTSQGVSGATPGGAAPGGATGGPASEGGEAWRRPPRTARRMTGILRARRSSLTSRRLGGLMDDRRRQPTLRAHFGERKTDLLRRLNRVAQHLQADELEARVCEMTRRQMRDDFGEAVRPGARVRRGAADPAPTSRTHRRASPREEALRVNSPAARGRRAALRRARRRRRDPRNRAQRPKGPSPGSGPW